MYSFNHLCAHTMEYFKKCKVQIHFLALTDLAELKLEDLLDILGLRNLLRDFGEPSPFIKGASAKVLAQMTSSNPSVTFDPY